MTVIVCSRGNPDRLRRAVASVLNQDLTPAQVIVVGHGEQQLPIDIATV